MVPLILLYLLVGLSEVYGDSHSLRYFYTAVSAPGTGMPEYSVAAYVDDQEITNYNSDSHECVPKAEWMNKLEPDYWERNTVINIRKEPYYKQNVQILMKRFNHTEGVHIVQVMHVCVLRDDGSTALYNHHGYDGRELMYLDTQSWFWIPTMYEAQITTQKWNNPDLTVRKLQKKYLENTCITWLKKHVENGREALEKRVRPEVKVWGRRQPDEVTRLQCLVYGFHPRAVDVRWVRNGEDHIPSDEISPILPHPDGTYQITVRVEVPTRKGDTYSCYVDHSSLEETLTATWEPENGFRPTSIVAAAICCPLLITAAICGAIWYRRRRSGYNSTSTSDNNSDSNNPPT